MVYAPNASEIGEPQRPPLPPGTDTGRVTLEDLELRIDPNDIGTAVDLGDDPENPPGGANNTLSLNSILVILMEKMEQLRHKWVKRFAQENGVGDNGNGTTTSGPGAKAKAKETWQDGAIPALNLNLNVGDEEEPDFDLGDPDKSFNDDGNASEAETALYQEAMAQIDRIEQTSVALSDKFGRLRERMTT